jgi:hypothetical protein
MTKNNGTALIHLMTAFSFLVGNHEYMHEISVGRTMEK